MIAHMAALFMGVLGLGEQLDASQLDVDVLWCPQLLFTCPRPCHESQSRCLESQVEIL